MDDVDDSAPVAWPLSWDQFRKAAGGADYDVGKALRAVKRLIHGDIISSWQPVPAHRRCFQAKLIRRPTEVMGDSVVVGLTNDDR